MAGRADEGRDVRRTGGTVRRTGAPARRTGSAAQGSRPRSAQAGGRRAPAAGRTPRASAAHGAPARKKAVRKKAAPRRHGRAALRLLVLVALLAVAAWLTVSRVFVLKEVRVEGNRGYTESEIAAMAGLTPGESIFNVSRESVSRSLSFHSDIKLLDFSVTYPDTAFLSILERQARAAINCAGVILIVDEDGQIMERLSSVPEGSVVVSGMDVSVSAQGRQIESARSWQLKDMREVLSEIDAQNMLSVISELNVADRYNLYLVSNTGVKIVLGDEENMSEKLVWARTVLEKLTEEGVMRGVLDVSTGKNAVYADR